MRGGGGDETKRKRKVLRCVASTPDEDEFIVVIPAVLLRIHPWFDVGTGRRGAGSAGSDALETGFLEHVERLFQEGVLEEESARVAVGGAAVRIAGLVESLAEDFAAEGHSAAHEDPGQFAEFDVGQAVAAEGERTAVADGDVAGSSCGDRLRYDDDGAFLAVLIAADAGSGGRLRVGGAAPGSGQQRALCRAAVGRSCQQRGLHLRHLEVVGLLFQPLALVKVLWQRELLVAQKVERVAEEDAVAVDKVLALGVAQDGLLGLAGTPAAREHLTEQRFRISCQRR